MENLELMIISKVKELMAQKSITVEKLAENSRYSARTIKHYLNGGNQGKMSVILPFEIARGLGVDVKQILVEDREAFFENIAKTALQSK